MYNMICDKKENLFIYKHFRFLLTVLGSVPIVLTEEESKPAEQFIFLCWTRHSHTLVQELMESTKQYVAEKQYAEALAALSEVIKIDPFFAEAYNRRATVHFGLKCADDCFADIERVSWVEGS